MGIALSTYKNFLHEKYGRNHIPIQKNLSGRLLKKYVNEKAVTRLFLINEKKDQAGQI